MTAVEWLFLMMNNPNKDQEFANKLFEKAKEMEKQQQDEQWDDGFDHGYCSRDHDDNDEFLDN